MCKNYDTPLQITNYFGVYFHGFPLFPPCLHGRGVFHCFSNEGKGPVETQNFASHVRQHNLNNTIFQPLRRKILRLYRFALFWRYFPRVFHFFHLVHMGVGVSTVFHFFHLVHRDVGFPLWGGNFVERHV